MSEKGEEVRKREVMGRERGDVKRRWNRERERERARQREREVRTRETLGPYWVSWNASDTFTRTIRLQACLPC